MKHYSAAELVLGVVGITGTLTLQEIAACAVAGVTILTMLPLLIWRWRALLRNEVRHEKRN